MLKEEIIKFRVTKEQKDKITAKAQKCGYSTSAYCLAVALKHKPQAVQSEDYLETLEELRCFYDCIKDNEEHRKLYEEMFLRLRSKAVK